MGGYLLFHEPATPKNVAGVCLAVCGIVAYTHLKISSSSSSASPAAPEKKKGDDDGEKVADPKEGAKKTKTKEGGALSPPARGIEPPKPSSKSKARSSTPVSSKS